jgi:hypothetical protein
LLIYFSITIVSILRLKSLVTFGADSMNPTWDFLNVGVWSTVEINVGIICICMPSLRLFLVRLFPRLLGTTRQYYAKYSDNQAQSTPRRRRPASLSHTAKVEAEPRSSRRNIDGIQCQESYTVEYGHGDEVELVRVQDVDMKSNGSRMSGVS